MPPQAQNWKYQMPKRQPRRRRIVPEGQWAVCWNFNSARGCPRGTSCPWRHQKYSTSGEPRDDRTNETITNVGRSRHVWSRSHQKGVPEIENKKQDEVVDQTSIPSKSPPIQCIPNVKARDIETDSKMHQKTTTSAMYGHNGGEATESDTDASGVE